MQVVPKLMGTLSLLAVFASVSSSAEASCGLDYCSLPRQATVTPAVGRAGVLLRHAAFSLPEGEGSYEESLFRLEFQRLAHWTLGAWVAPVRLTIGEEVRHGVTNPVFFVERSHRLSSAFSVLAGAQLEVPLGDSHDGIASNHTELLSYLGVRYRQRAVQVQLRAGAAAALSEGHHHDGTAALFVNPHADKEALVRLAMTVPLLSGRLQPGLIFNSRIVLEEGPERHFGTGALAATYQVGSSLSVQAQVEVPVTVAERISWRAGVGVGLSL